MRQRGYSKTKCPIVAELKPLLFLDFDGLSSVMPRHKKVARHAFDYSVGVSLWIVPSSTAA